MSGILDSAGPDKHERADAPDFLERRSALYRRAVNVERMVTCGVLVATLVVVLLQIVTRYVFANPLSWTEELARFLLVWLTFLAAGYVMSRRLHIAVDLLVARVSRRTAVAVDTFALVVVLVAAAAMSVAGALFAVEAVHLLAPATRLPMAVVYLAAVVGSLLMFVHGLLNLVVNLRHPDEVPDAMENVEREGI